MTRDDARNADLERALLANPRDVDAYLVYADWLLEQGDPRGELIATQIAAERGGPDQRRNALAVFARHRELFLGALADTIRADAFDWKRGFIHHARLARTYGVVTEGNAPKLSLAELAAQLFRSPSARFLVKLTVGDPSPPPPQPRMYWERVPPRVVDDFSGVADRIAALAPPTLRELHLVTPTQRFRLDLACPGLAHLTDLEIDGLATTSNLALPALRFATIRAPSITPAQLRELARATWPRLQSLTIDFGSGSSAGAADLEPLLARIDLTALSHLALVHCSFANHVLPRIAAAPILAQLAELQITDSALSDQGVRGIAREHRAFRHLELFDVTGNQLSGTGIRLLRAIAPDVIV